MELPSMDGIGKSTLIEIVLVIIIKRSKTDGEFPRIHRSFPIDLARSENHGQIPRSQTSHLYSEELIPGNKLTSQAWSHIHMGRLIASRSLGALMVSMLATEWQEVWIGILLWMQYFPFYHPLQTYSRVHT